MENQGTITNDQGRVFRVVKVDGELRINGRPDWHGGGMAWAQTTVKRHPKYVYGTRMGKLLHEIAQVTLCWWQLGGHGEYFFRVQSPRVWFETKCGYHFFGSDPQNTFISSRKSRATVCEIPKPDAVLCGRCRGEGPVFGKHAKVGRGGVTYKQARERIGCVIQV